MLQTFSVPFHFYFEKDQARKSVVLQSRNRYLLETLYQFNSKTIAISVQTKWQCCRALWELSYFLNFTSNGQKLEELWCFKVSPGLGHATCFDSKPTCQKPKNSKISYCYMKWLGVHLYITFEHLQTFLVRFHFYFEQGQPRKSVVLQSRNRYLLETLHWFISKTIAIGVQTKVTML